MTVGTGEEWMMEERVGIGEEWMMEEEWVMERVIGEEWMVEGESRDW